MTSTRRLIAFASFALAAMAHPVAVRAAGACGQLESFTLDGQSIRIDRAEQVPAGPAPARPGAPPAAKPLMLPAHCRVDGVLDPRTGRNGKPYAIGFSIALPDDWNGRFFFQGGGGLNGTVNPPYGAQYAGDTAALAQGFAVASTDSGHSASGFDATFFEDQEASINFLYQAVAKVTVVGKAIVAKHYGKAAHHAYFVGCSTGGREAMMMSQRFPGNFDGIVAGAPATRTGYSNLGLRWVTTALNQVAPPGPDGKPQTRLALSDADRRLVVDGLLAACDALDGRRDGLVSAPLSCGFDPKVLACRAGKQPDCLSVEQVAAVQKAMSGPRTSSGRQVYPGYFYDTGIVATRGLPGLLVGPVIPEGPASGTSLDVDAEAARAHDARSMAGDTNAWTNLSSFRGHGGKLIFFHGVSDPWFSAKETVDYYERLQRDNAEVPIDSWSRLFLVPGMGHCAGGERTPDRFDLVSAIVSWTENNTPPERVVATGESMQGESRPLCPYPAQARYSGNGDPKDAANYSCRK